MCTRTFKPYVSSQETRVRERFDQRQKCIKHVIEKEEPRFWDVDNSMEEVADVLIILGSDDSSDNN